jgi:hypothetical protein
MHMSILITPVAVHRRSSTPASNRYFTEIIVALVLTFFLNETGPASRKT